MCTDGDSSNRKFFKMHNIGLPVPYKAKNVYATDGRWLTSLVAFTSLLLLHVFSTQTAGI